MTAARRLAARKAAWARILSEFPGVLPEHLAEMTDFQIEELYLHAREKDGRIKAPAPEQAAPAPASAEEHVARYLAVASAANERRPGAFPADVVESRVAAIREHHAKKESGRCQPPQS